MFQKDLPQMVGFSQKDKTNIWNQKISIIKYLEGIKPSEIC